MSHFYSGKKILVIGATSGIGRELSSQLLKQGATVVGTGRRVELMQDLKSKYPQKFLPLYHDVQVTRPSEIYQKALEFLASVDVLILNSGYGQQNSQLDQNIEHQTIQTNVIGVGSLLIEGFHLMRTQGRGTIAVVSSIAGTRGLRQAPSYCASKSFLSTLCESLNHISKKNHFDISVVDIRPGFVQTAMGNNSAAFWSSSTEKACHQILQGIRHSPQVLYVTRRWKWVGLILRIIPRWIMQKF